MKILTKILVATALVATSASPVLAGGNSANSAYKKVQKEWKKSRKTGGYDNPLIAFPVSLFDAMTDVAESATTATKSSDAKK